tara:strand:+ start:19 stop:744 length:726 start_codon:yes stop_codon:yes gene_type:complete
MKKSISIIIPLYNEGKGLENILSKVNNIVNKLFDDYELLIFNDCSKDRTGEIVDKLAKKNPNIRVFHNKKNMNLGYNYRVGIKYATKKYLMFLPGPDNMTMSSIENFMTNVGDKPIVTAYIGNQKIRPLNRRIISWSFINMMNLLFGLHMKYYLGVAAYETKLIKSVKKSTNSFALPAEVLIRLIKKGHPYKEVPIYALEIPDNPTNAFRIKNIVGISRAILRLFFEIHFIKNSKYSGGTK